MSSRPSAPSTNKQGGRLCRHRTNKDPTAFRGGGRGRCLTWGSGSRLVWISHGPMSGAEVVEYRLLIIYFLIHIIGWFCHSHGDTTVSPKRRISVIILLSSCYHSAFILHLFVCDCNVFLFCCVFFL